MAIQVFEALVFPLIAISRAVACIDQRGRLRAPVAEADVFRVVAPRQLEAGEHLTLITGQIVAIQIVDLRLPALSA